MSTAALLEKAAIRKMIMPISVAQYHKMSEFSQDLTKTELIEGIIIEKMTKSPLLTYLLHWLFEFFSSKLSEGYLLRKEDPLTLAASEPEPDIAIVKGSFEDFKHKHPVRAELVIEIAISSLELDREKAEIYALAGIPEYWIIVPRDAVVEVYQEPIEGKYQTIRRHEKTEVIATAWGGLALEKLFGLG